MSTAPPVAGSSTVGAPAGTGSARPVAPAHPVPAAFRPAPGAPSDAEVQRELAQMAAVQRRQQQQALSAAAANLAGLLPWSLEPKSGVRSSVASVFTDYGLGLACGGVLGRSQLGVAHKTAPCGTLITFTYAGRSLTVPVIDRGPYIVGREWDLTGATAAALAFPGLGQIQWSVAG
ncbi:MAG: RlpA-like double-psi beta-barrel domain-containing protein [Solirubrobacteraceae bacterium]